MLQPRRISHISRVLPESTSICLQCQHPRFERSLASQCSAIRTFTSARVLRNPESNSKDDEYIPRPLGRPIGFRNPPRAGEVPGVEAKKKYTGSLRQRNLAKREDLQKEWGQNYFRDAINVRKHRGGKTFAANAKLFRREVALYFPNVKGRTLAAKDADLAPVLKGKVSVINMQGSDWGVRQVNTFVGKTENPELQKLLKQHHSIAQRVDIQVEDNIAKRWLVSLFDYRLRKMRPQEDWGKYFVLKGLPGLVRETIGCLNARVGYVYLVDQECRIRWAGSGDAEPAERESLTRGVQRLVEEARGRRRMQKPDVEEELVAQAVNAGAS